MGTPSLPRDSSEPEEPGNPAMPENAGVTNKRAIASLMAGLVVTGVLAVVAGSFFGSAHPQTRRPQARGSSPGLRRAAELASGACFDLPASKRQGVPEWVGVAACSQPHDRQLYARIVLRGPYPGDLRDQQETGLACVTALGEFLDPLGIEEASRPFFYPPAQADWQAGNPQAWCTLAGQTGQLTGDLSQVPGDYTTEQLEFLRATHVSELLALEVETSLQANLDQARGFASELAAAYRAEARQLDTLRLPLRGQQDAVAAIARDDLAEVAQAQALASTGSQSQAAQLAERMSSFTYGPDMHTVRVQLGLNAA